MTGPHDAIQVTVEADHTTVCCSCGREFTYGTRQAATDAHRGHHGIELARQALAGHHDLEGT